MKSFVKVNLGNKVFDSAQQVEGVVKYINYETNIAQVVVDPLQEEVVLCKVANLTVLGNENKANGLSIKIKYFNPEQTKLTKISQGDWIDLRSAETIEIKEGEFKLIPLGVAMKLPEDYEAVIAPRGSTFKNFGIIETNSIGVVDNSFSGNDDQWFFPAYALRDTVINFDERICQFRIQERMPEIEFTEVDELDDANRGSHGSTGVK